MNTNSPYYYVSRYRSELMGIAILWVLCYHSTLLLDFIPFRFVREAVEWIKLTGYGGVDVFFFLSGMGVYRSLEKNRVSTYVKNRMRRILPTWWTWLIILVLLSPYLYETPFSKKAILGFATFTGMWLGTEKQGDWYLYVIMLLYLLAPALFALLQDSKNRLRTGLLITAAAGLISLAALGEGELLIYSRFPVFVMGMLLPAAMTECSMSRGKWIVCLLAFTAASVLLYFAIKKVTVGKLWYYGLIWYPFAVIAPTLCMLIGKTFAVFPRGTKVLQMLFAKLGKASLEILLVTDTMLGDVVKMDFLQNFQEQAVKAFLLFGGIALGYLFHLFIQYEKRWLDKGFEILRKRTEAKA